MINSFNPLSLLISITLDVNFLQKFFVIDFTIHLNFYLAQKIAIKCTKPK